MQIIALDKLKNRTLLGVLISFLAISTYRMDTSFETFNEKKTWQKISIFKQSSYIYKTKLNEIDKSFTSRLKNIISNKEIRESLKNRDALKLYSQTLEPYETLKKDFPAIKIMHYYQADGKSFLKMCTPDSNQDKLHKQRPIILKTINTISVQSGFEPSLFTKNDFPYGIVVPIIDGKQLIGAVELGIDTKGILEQINNFFRVSSEYKVYVGSLFTKNGYSKNTSGALKLTDYTLVTNDNTIKQIIKKIDSPEKEQVIEFGGKKFFVFWGKEKLEDFNHKQVGTLFYAFDITELENEFKSNLIHSISQPIVVMILLYLTFSFLFNYIKKQSNLHNEKLSGIVDNQSSLIILTNGLTIIQSNQSFLKFFNISSVEEFLRKYTCVCEKFEEEDGYLKEKYEDNNWLNFILDNPDIIHKAKMRDEDGKIHIFQVNARSIKQEDRFEYVVSFDDITSLVDVNKNLEKLVSEKTSELREINSKLKLKIKEAVEENRLKDQHLFQQSRLAQMGEMISMIAHQWRQPLSAINAVSLSISIKAKLNKLDNDIAISLSDKISRYSQHLSTTIDDFRDFFKTNKDKSDTTFNELLRKVLDIVETSIINKDIDLIKNLNSQETLNTYPNELKQVILNLIKNAEDVLLDRGIENPKIIIETDKNVLVVRDNAGGIPEEIIDKVFDPYFSTKDKKNGTGLGLYMSKTIIEDHCGGKLSVSNNEEGAVFRLELPL